MNLLLLILLPIFMIMGLLTGNYTLIFSGVAMLSMMALLSALLGAIGDNNTEENTTTNDPLQEMLNNLDNTSLTITDFFSHHSMLIAEIIGITLALATISFFGWCLWNKHHEEKAALSIRLEKSLHKRLELDSILLASLQKRGIISGMKESTV